MEGGSMKNISTKIWAGFISLIVLMSILVGVSYYQLGQLQTAVTTLNDHRIPMTNTGQQLALDFYRMTGGVRGYLATGTDKFIDEYNDAQKAVTEQAAYMEGHMLTEENKAAFEQVKVKMKEFEQVPPQVFALHKGGDIEGALSLFLNQGAPTNAAAIEEINKFVDLQKQKINEDGENVEAVTESIKRVALILLLAGIILGLIIAFSITKPITIALAQVGNVSAQYAEGDFRETIRYKSADELGQLANALNKMKESFVEVIIKLKDSSGQLNESARELAAQAQQTSAGASETASTVGEIATTVNEVANNAKEVSVLSEKASGEAEIGAQGIARVNGQMQIIATTSDEASMVVGELSNTLNQVNQIVDLITSIADQTNLLALNAAIEAARAGEQGRGFAVVAEEVRKLAEQSASAAKDINHLIEKVQDESKKAVNAMVEGNKQVKEGSVVTEEVGNNLNIIISSVAELAEQIQSVAVASEQISSGVQNAAGTIEEQTAAIEEVSASTEQLTHMANELNDLVEKFKV